MTSVLFVHQNFPAQFGPLAADLAQTPGMKVAAIGSVTAGSVRGVDVRTYSVGLTPGWQTHSFARRFDAECRRAEQVLYAAQEFLDDGFDPDIVVVHPGWGESLALRAAFPKARIAVYCEYHYNPRGADVGFDPADAPIALDAEVALRARNAATLLALAECDVAVAPTQWQRSTFPAALRDRIAVCHEGIDTEVVKPRPDATFSPRPGLTLSRADRVVTFVARDLEPLRGYLSFIRAVPSIQAGAPDAHIVVIGGDGTSYGAPPPRDSTWKDVGLRSTAGALDSARIHFTGRLTYDAYLSALQISSAHVYLTAPFVLSWSMTEAMAAGAPLIASDTPPCREFVDATNGVLVDFFDPAAIASAVLDTLDRPEEAQKRATNARSAIAQHLSRDRCLTRMKELLGILASD